MKKFSLYVILIASVLMVGCNKKRYEPVIPEEDAWMYDATLPVPIKFGISNGITTKGMVEGWDDLGDRKIGIFGLPKNLEEGYQTSYPWGLTTGGKLIVNEPSAVVFTDAVGNGTIKFDNGPFYYPPKDNSIKYSFFAYYPYDALSNLSYGESASDYMRGDIKIDGKTDIMWAKAVTDGNGYNAQYLRDAAAANPQDQTAIHPKLEFKHLLTAFNFYIEYEKPAIDGGASREINIESIDFINVYTQVKMRIAARKAKANQSADDSADDSPDEHCGYLDTTDGTIGTLSVDGSGFVDIKVNELTKNTKYGTIMLYSGQTTSNSSWPEGWTKFSVKIRYNNGEGTETLTQELNLTRKEGFEPGQQYGVTITFQGDIETRINASLQRWSDQEQNKNFSVGSGSSEDDDNTITFD